MFKKRLQRKMTSQFELALSESLPALVGPAVDDRAPESAAAHRVVDGSGAEVYQLDDDEPWSVRDDGLVDRLRLPSTRAAEVRVGEALRRANPALLKRLEFDSDSESFLAYAPTREDAVALQRFLSDLK